MNRFLTLYLYISMLSAIIPLLCNPHLISKCIAMIEVKQSPLHGRGLFAATCIPAGTVLGDLVTEPAGDHELDGPYVLWLDDTMPVKVTCDLRFINHSDAPNAVYYDDMTVVALCDIEPGEEILHDYMGDAIDHETPIDFEDSTPCADQFTVDNTTESATDELAPGVA